MGAIASRYRVHNSGLVNLDPNPAESAPKLDNPGTLDELHKKTKGLWLYCNYALKLGSLFEKQPTFTHFENFLL